MSKNISRIRGAIIKASRKTAHNKKKLGTKRTFVSQKNGRTKFVYWYQCFSLWKMVGAKSLVHGQPPSWPNVLPFIHTHIAYAASQWANIWNKMVKN